MNKILLFVCYFTPAWILCFIVLLIGVNCDSLPNSKKWICIVGTYTEGTGSKGIYVYEVSMKSKQAFPISYAAELSNPSYVCLDRSKEYLYAVEEVDSFNDQQSGAVACYKIEKDFHLSFVNKQSSAGTFPCYASISQDGTKLFVANYGSGSCSMFPIHAGTKRILPMYDSIQHVGISIDSIRQRKAHAHWIGQNPGMPSTLYALDLGMDAIMMYRIQQDSITRADSTQISSGSGPRHMAFHPTKPIAYVVHELNSSVGIYHINVTTQKLEYISEVSTVPDAYDKKNLPSGIAVHSSGETLYTLNRGQDAVVSFHIDAEGRELTEASYISTLGDGPRSLTISSDGALIFIANKNRGGVTIYALDPLSGSIIKEDVMQIAIPGAAHVALIEY